MALFVDRVRYVKDTILLMQQTLGILRENKSANIANHCQSFTKMMYKILDKNHYVSYLAESIALYNSFSQTLCLAFSGDSSINFQWQKFVSEFIQDFDNSLKRKSEILFTLEQLQANLYAPVPPRDIEPLWQAVSMHDHSSQGISPHFPHTPIEQYYLFLRDPSHRRFLEMLFGPSEYFVHVNTISKDLNPDQKFMSEPFSAVYF